MYHLNIGYCFMDVTPELLAKEFSKVLNEWLSDDEMKEVRRLNDDEMNKDICHSHDYCDANQAMINACEKLGFDCMDMQLTGDAWNISKNNGFKL